MSEHQHADTFIMTGLREAYSAFGGGGTGVMSGDVFAATATEHYVEFSLVATSHTPEHERLRQRRRETLTMLQQRQQDPQQGVPLQQPLVLQGAGALAVALARALNSAAATTAAMAATAAVSATRTAQTTPLPTATTGIEPTPLNAQTTSLFTVPMPHTLRPPPVRPVRPTLAPPDHFIVSSANNLFYNGAAAQHSVSSDARQRWSAAQVGRAGGETRAAQPATAAPAAPVASLAALSTEDVEVQVLHTAAQLRRAFQAQQRISSPPATMPTQGLATRLMPSAAAAQQVLTGQQPWPEVQGIPPPYQPLLGYQFLVQQQQRQQEEIIMRQQQGLQHLRLQELQQRQHEEEQQQQQQVRMARAPL